MQALRLALLALDGGITLEPFSDYIVLSFEVSDNVQVVLLCPRQSEPFNDHVLFSLRWGP